MARAPALFFRLELADAIVYKITTAFVDFNFTFLFIIFGKSSLPMVFFRLHLVEQSCKSKSYSCPKDMIN